MEFTFQRMYRGPLKAVLLDWAGTTMDYGCFAPAVVFMEVFKRKGVEITIEEAREPMGAHKKVHIRQIAKNESVAKRWQQALGNRAVVVFLNCWCVRLPSCLCLGGIHRRFAHQQRQSRERE